MWKFIKELPTATRGQRVIQALVLLVAVGSTVWGLRNVPRLIRNTDWWMNKPLFDEGRIEGGRYINDSLGWEMAIPGGWNLAHASSSGKRRRDAERLKDTLKKRNLQGLGFESWEIS